MTQPIPTESAAHLLRAQGVACTPQGAEAAAAFAALVLDKSAPGFAKLPFEAEPANYTAALRRAAP